MHAQRYEHPYLQPFWVADTHAEAASQYSVNSSIYNFPLYPECNDRLYTGKNSQTFFTLTGRVAIVQDTYCSLRYVGYCYHVHSPSDSY